MSMDKGIASDNEETTKFTEVLGRKKRRASKNHMEVEVINGIEEKMKPHTFFKRTGNFQGGEQRTVSVPAHRYTPLKKNWLQIFIPVVDCLKLQIRFNLKTKNVELQAAPGTSDTSNLQKCADFVRAFTYGFEIDDALAFLRSDDLFIETFEIHDVKRLKGDHLSRAIERLAVKGEKMKFTIEDLTNTSIVLADTKIHILGYYQDIQLARRAIFNIILGRRPPSKVYEQLKKYYLKLSKVLYKVLYREVASRVLD